MKQMETIKVKMSKAKNEQETANLIELEKKQKQLFQKMEQTELEKEQALKEKEEAIAARTAENEKAAQQVAEVEEACKKAIVEMQEQQQSTFQIRLQAELAKQRALQDKEAAIAAQAAEADKAAFVQK